MGRETEQAVIAGTLKSRFGLDGNGQMTTTKMNEDVYAFCLTTKESKAAVSTEDGEKIKSYYELFNNSYQTKLTYDYIVLSPSFSKNIAKKFNLDSAQESALLKELRGIDGANPDVPQEKTKQLIDTTTSFLRKQPNSTFTDADEVAMKAGYLLTLNNTNRRWSYLSNEAAIELGPTFANSNNPLDQRALLISSTLITAGEENFSAQKITEKTTGNIAEGVKVIPLTVSSAVPVIDPNNPAVVNPNNPTVIDPNNSATIGTTKIQTTPTDQFDYKKYVFQLDDKSKDVAEYHKMLNFVLGRTDISGKQIGGQPAKLDDNEQTATFTEESAKATFDFQNGADNAESNANIDDDITKADSKAGFETRTHVAATYADMVNKAENVDQGIKSQNMTLAFNTLNGFAKVGADYTFQFTGAKTAGDLNMKFNSLCGLEMFKPCIIDANIDLAKSNKIFTNNFKFTA
ncbi:MAG: hypothetical protein ACT4OY_03355 [Alphaproteobacteria bacterium]